QSPFHQPEGRSLETPGPKLPEQVRPARESGRSVLNHFSTSHSGARSYRLMSAQVRQGGAEIDVEGLTVDDEGRHRRHPHALGLRDAGLLFAEVDHLHRVAPGVERLDELLLGRYTDGAARMEEHSLAHGYLLLDLYASTRCIAKSRLEGCSRQDASTRYNPRT